MDEAQSDLLDWDTWLTAQGYPDLKPAASIRFDSYEQMIEAALSGQGVAMGIGRLVERPDRPGQAGGAVLQSRWPARAPISSSARPRRGTRPHVQAFVDWLIEEAKTAIAVEGPPEALSSPPPAARSRRRSAASTLKAVMRAGAGILLGRHVLDGHGEVRGV